MASGRLRRCRLPWAADASQLVEFAIALPLLVVLVVGIFDFGGALNLKGQLTNAAREGAHLASTLPITDIGGPSTPPLTVSAVQSLVDSYLLRSAINDCGLGSASLVVGASPYSWTAQTNTGCAGNLTLTIDRAYMFRENSIDVICAHIEISYPYQWRFNSVIQLLIPGANYGAPIQITADSIMPTMH